MNKLTSLVQEFIKDESGLTAVEYAIAGGLVVGGMVLAFSDLGTSATAKIEDLCNAVNGSTDGSSTTGCTENAPTL